MLKEIGPKILALIVAGYQSEENFQQEKILFNAKSAIEQQRDKETAQFLAAMSATNEQNPLLAFSVDHNEADPNSPVICLIIPTISADFGF